MRRAALVAATAVVVCLLADVAPAGAAADGGASSRVVGRGDIVTSILGWKRRRPAAATSSAPACEWRTLTDAQLEWLTAVAARATELGYRSPLLDPVDALASSGSLPDGDLQAYVCGVDTYELRFSASTGPKSLQEHLVRRMITRLPAPDPTLSPPDGTSIPVGQPVFISIHADGWRPIDAALTHEGVTAQVHAEPVGIRVISGDPSVSSLTCTGPGRAFDPFDQRSVAAQARTPDACTLAYRTATAGRKVDGSDDPRVERPEAWLGTITIVWSARWRVGDGAWIDLGVIPRTRLIARSVRELSTTIEHRG